MKLFSRVLWIEWELMRGRFLFFLTNGKGRETQVEVFFLLRLFPESSGQRRSRKTFSPSFTLGAASFLSCSFFPFSAWESVGCLARWVFEENCAVPRVPPLLALPSVPAETHCSVRTRARAGPMPTEQGLVRANRRTGMEGLVLLQPSCLLSFLDRQQNE